MTSIPIPIVVKPETRESLYTFTKRFHEVMARRRLLDLRIMSGTSLSEHSLDSYSALIDIYLNLQTTILSSDIVDSFIVNNTIDAYEESEVSNIRVKAFRLSTDNDTCHKFLVGFNGWVDLYNHETDETDTSFFVGNLLLTIDKDDTVLLRDIELQWGEEFYEGRVSLDSKYVEEDFSLTPEGLLCPM